MTKYTCKLTFGYSGGTARIGEVVELDDAEARQFHKAKAIGLYIGDGETAPDELPKAKKKRTGKPAAPTPLGDHQTIMPDPKAK